MIASESIEVEINGYLFAVYIDRKIIIRDGSLEHFYFHEIENGRVGVGGKISETYHLQLELDAYPYKEVLEKVKRFAAFF